MDTYILDRMRADAAHLRALGQSEGKLQHLGMRGRFRELLLDNLLRPWLPPYVSCGTGMIIAAENVARDATQDDIIVYDTSLTPPVLVSRAHAPDGVFLYNSVLARIEVKSTVTRADIASFVRASRDIAALKHSVQPGFADAIDGAYNLLFAFASDAHDATPDYQLLRAVAVMKEEGLDPLSGVVSMICVLPYGFWKIGMENGNRVWQRLETGNEHDAVVWFVACLSTACYFQHARRQGRDPAKGLESGVGMYLPHPFKVVALPA